jgi:hypothetical protein
MEETKNILYKLVGTLFGLFLICFIVVNLYLLAIFLYSTPTVEPVPQDGVMKPDKFSKSIEQALGADHFHMLDETVYTDLENAPVCLQCHGNFCHEKSEWLRSFYNMHTFFLACETCHIRVREGENVLFRWIDDRTGLILKEVSGSDGNYGAKIVPIKDDKRLDTFPKEGLAREYMLNQDTYTEEEKERLQAELMAHISEEPVKCEECHHEKGYIDFTALGYTPVITSNLSHVSIVKLTEEYKEFHLPTMFDPCVVKGEDGCN